MLVLQNHKKREKESIKWKVWSNLIIKKKKKKKKKKEASLNLANRKNIDFGSS